MDSTGQVKHSKFCDSNTDPNKQANDNEAFDSEGKMDSTGQIKHSSCSKQNQHLVSVTANNGKRLV